MSKARVWNEDLPIYRQIMEEILAQVRDGSYAEGELLPSVRQLASDFQVNPLTVAKALREVAKEDLTEKRRGIGLVVKKGAQRELQRRERTKFLQEEWPEILVRMKRMGIDIAALLQAGELGGAQPSP
jgi:GntR family transcriptional regulator